ncbi:MAG: membrane protein insertase YidC [Treponema sp.]|jgi:YidC/Oxa1 family membrane protein insertase|nr:membrane protein insertase YidC [Treponema sp.]
MERNTIIAVALSSVVLITFYVLQGVFFPPRQPLPVTSVATEVTATDSSMALPSLAEQSSIEQSGVETTAGESSLADPFTVQPSAGQGVSGEMPDQGPQQVETVTIETELLVVTLTNVGGDIVSWKLKEHFDNEENVNMILAGVEEPRAFSIAFGGSDARPVSDLFYVTSSSSRERIQWVEFHRDFASAGGNFRLTKRYEFAQREYMFKLSVTLDGGYYGAGFNFGGSAYTINFGPQIGPRFQKLDNRYDYRQYMVFANGKRKNVKANEIIDTRPTWAAISGKYFAFIAVPNLNQYIASFSDRAENGLTSASRFIIVRPSIDASRMTDTYHFYLGPKTQDTLSAYHSGRNEFGFIGSNIVDVASTRGILAPLEKLLKWMLLLFYKVVPNYGIAIIMLTLFVKIAFFPLTKKGSEATLRMQALAPKIKEIQDKYKGNPQKLNAEMGAFYQREGYNPISGCLPMLLQIPIFFAMYSLFNNHFDLRGAMFIPGWIPDLSVPESLVNFPDGFSLPILGWTALRGLPFIYVGSQLIYGKVTQTPGQQSNSQMKMMLYVMPVMFFFILYNVPSGLLIYWIFSNVLTLAQQVIINKYNQAKKAQEELAGGALVKSDKSDKSDKPVIAPPKKKRK